jgi:hypothetical protein
MINVQKERMTLSQLLIFAWIVCIALGAILFVYVADRPGHLKVLQAKDRVDFLESRLKWVDATIEELQEPTKVFDYFVSQDRDLARRFPDSAERSLIALADYANKFGVRAEQIHAEKPKRVVSARGGPLGADGKVCAGVQVSLKFKSEYDNLVKYVETMRKVLPAFLVVRKMTAVNNFSESTRIEGQLDLTLYLLE